MKRQPLEAFRSAVLLAAMLLAGCGAWAPRAQERPQAVETVPATPPAPPPPAPVQPQPQPDEETPAAIEPPPLKDILAYAHRAARFTPAELAAELARLTPQQDASAQQQLELALALGQTRQPADTARALALVQRVIARSDGPPPTARWHACWKTSTCSSAAWKTRPTARPSRSKNCSARPTN
ncbi:hypothetical protein [Acidovorax sp. SDU_ACID1]|uniref:hypothetical protein n=1 Tax=Acidovorax sp. SDU_ACID1 TaxID=3136632 RepID=UPI0038739771